MLPSSGVQKSANIATKAQIIFQYKLFLLPNTTSVQNIADVVLSRIVVLSSVQRRRYSMRQRAMALTM